MHVTESLGGGTQSAIRAFSRSHPARHIVIGRAREGEDTGRFEPGVEVTTVSKGLASFLLYARSAVIRHSPDVVHLHSSFAGIARAVLPRGTKIVYSPHCFAFERLDLASPIRRLLRSVEWILGRRRQSVAAVCAYEAKTAQRLVARSSQVVLVPNVSDYQPQPLDIPSNSGVHIVTCGRIGPQKDPKFFADLASHLDPNSRLTWIGDGDVTLRSELESAGVNVTGWIDADSIAETFRAATLYVHTAQWEASPYALLDAAQSNLPILTKSIPSLESLGYVSVPGDARALAQAVRRFFQEPSYADHVAKVTREVVERNSQKELAAALATVYDS